MHSVEMAKSEETQHNPLRQDSGGTSDDGLDESGEWVRLADPDGWVHVRCPAGFPQLEPPDASVDYHKGRPERELEALCPCLGGPGAYDLKPRRLL